MREIRASALPRVAKCAPSAVPPQTRIEGDGYPSRLGNAFHSAMAELLPGGDPDPAVIAAQHNVSRDDLAPLLGWARREWAERLSAAFPAPVVERELTTRDGGGRVRLSGHPDFFAVVGDEVRGGDWKTGWSTEADYLDQGKGYGWLLLKKHSAATCFRWTVIWVREQRADTYVWTRDELARWWGWLVVHLAEATEVYRPGAHCGYCPRALECPGQRGQLAALASVLEVVEPLGEDVAAAYSPERLARVVESLRFLEKRIGVFMAAAKAEVIARGGTYGPLSVEQTERQSIEVSRGWDVLTAFLDRDRELLPLLKVSKSDVIDALTAPRGQKKALIEKLLGELADAGALKTTIVETLKVRREHGDRDPIQSIPATADAIGAAGD